MSEYDLSTFTGRFMFYLNMTDPRTLLYSEDKVKRSKSFVDTFEAEGLKPNDEYKFHKKICDAAIHPVTGEIIPRLFRVSCIAPVNIPLVFLMITCPSSNVAGTLFLHWLNQSYNTACNYANRAGADQSMEDTAKVRDCGCIDLSDVRLFKAYGLAVTSACTFAYGLGRLSSRAPGFLRRFSVIIPVIATSAANVSNVAFTRADEIINGAPVYNSNDEVDSCVLLCSLSI